MGGRAGSSLTGSLNFAASADAQGQAVEPVVDQARRLGRARC